MPAPRPPRHLPAVAARSRIAALSGPHPKPRLPQLQQQAARITAELDAALGRPSGAADGPSADPDNGGGSSQPPAKPAGRAPIAAMSAEVVDSNPYSRLMALQRMGIVKDYERIRDKSVRALEPVASAAAEGSAAAGSHCETFCWIMPDLEGCPLSSREPDVTQVHLTVRDAPLAACRGSVCRSASHMMISVSASIAGCNCGDGRCRKRGCRDADSLRHRPAPDVRYALVTIPSIRLIMCSLCNIVLRDGAFFCKRGFQVR